MFFSLCRIDDLKNKKIKNKTKNKKTWQVTEQELNRVNFANVLIFNNKNFELQKQPPEVFCKKRCS